MNAHDKRIALQRATMQTLFAIAALGGRFYDALGIAFGPMGADTLATHVAHYTATIRDAVASTYAEACAVDAFAIERCDASGTMRGFRLIRLGGGPSKTGHRYSGDASGVIFRDADALWDAMRTVEDLATHPACERKGPSSTPEATREIHASANRWRDSNGTTYHRVTVLVNGREVYTSPVSYGYDQAYQETAAEGLESLGILTRERYGSGGVESLTRACDRLGIAFTSHAVNVKRRKDL